MTRKIVIIAVMLFALVSSGLVVLFMDFDNDGLFGCVELLAATDPFNSDTDSDGLNDREEPDFGTNPLLFDEDEDGLNEGKEVELGTSLFLVDSDNDYISDGLEVNEYGSDPLKIDTDDGGVDDFNEIYTYDMNPNDPKDDEEFMEKIPNVIARHWGLEDGEVEDYTFNKYVTISMRDPLVQWYAELAEIKWETTPEGEKLGVFYVDAERIFKEYGYGGEEYHHVIQPSYYFTHGRKAQCVESSLSNRVILKLMGYKAIDVGGDVPHKNETARHAWVEAYINGEVYVVNFNRVYPREGFYEERGWTIIRPKDYDPNWYKE